MIQEHLKLRQRQGRFYNSWLIDAPNIAPALEELQAFIESDLFLNKMPLKNHPDYSLIVKENSKGAREISVEQIRELQQFFSRTSVISPYRVVVIYQADLMNLNAANSCLKLLEDTPKNGFVFLVTARGAAIISTVRSRCAKINMKSPNYLENNDTYSKFITYLADYVNPTARLMLLGEFVNSNKELWGDFASSILYLLNKITKKFLNCNIELNQLENKIFNKLYIPSIDGLIKKFIHIKQIINNTMDYDLNLKSSTIEVIEELFR